MPESPNFHDQFSSAADKLASKAIESLEDALDSKKKYRVTCPKCKAHFAAPFPDYAVRVKAAEFIRDTGKGKPAQRQAPKEEPKQAERKLEDLSIEELMALANLTSGWDAAGHLMPDLEDRSGKTDGGAA